MSEEEVPGSSVPPPAALGQVGPLRDSCERGQSRKASCGPRPVRPHTTRARQPQAQPGPVLPCSVRPPCSRVDPMAQVPPCLVERRFSGTCRCTSAARLTQPAAQEGPAPPLASRRTLSPSPPGARTPFQRVRHKRDPPAFCSCLETSNNSPDTLPVSTQNTQ